MLPDQFFPINEWVNLYDLTGLPAGTSIKVTNKTHFQTFCWEGANPPPDVPDMCHGEPLACAESARNTDLTVPYWILSYSPTPYPGNMGRISVQEWLL